MANNPGRPLAPHVQAAIARGQQLGAQPKVEGEPPERPMAAHVRQAVLGPLQPKAGERLDHVRAAIAQAKRVGPRRALQLAAAAPVAPALDLAEIAHVVADHTGRDDNWALAHGKGIFNPTFLEAYDEDAGTALAAIARDLLANGARGVPTVNATGDSVVEVYRKYSDLPNVGVPTGWNVNGAAQTRTYRSGVTMRCRVDVGGLTLLTMFPAGAHPYADP